MLEVLRFSSVIISNASLERYPMNIFKNLVYAFDMKIIALKKCRHKFETRSRKLEQMLNSK